MTEENDTFGRVILIFIAVCALAYSFKLGCDFGVSRVRADAIENKAGYWAIDPQTSRVTFEWTKK